MTTARAPDRLSRFGLAGALLCFSLACALSSPVPAYADDRMAGSSPRARSTAPPPLPDESDARTPAQAIAAVEIKLPPPATPTPANVDYAQLESYGTLGVGDPDYLGIDIWRGSSRSQITALLDSFHGQHNFPSLYNLSKNVLNGRSNPALARQDVRPEPGRDLTTLRIKAMMQMGDYHGAVSLYSQHAAGPYHESMAMAGILALLYTKEPSLACLDAQTYRPENVTGSTDKIFWQKVDSVCAYGIRRHQTPGASVRETLAKNAGSTIISALIRDESYRFRPSGIADFKTLSPLEAASLHAFGRVDLRQMPADSFRGAPVHVLTLMRGNPTLQPESALALEIEAARRGLIPPEELVSYYQALGEEHFKSEKTSLLTYRNIASWQRLPYLYRAIIDAAKGEERAAILEKALALHESYDSAALWPFAILIADTDPERLPPALVEVALRILIETGYQPTAAWIESAADHIENGLLFAALPLYTDLSTDMITDIMRKKFSKTPPSAHDMAILKTIYEKVDKSVKLHNIVDSDFYEKQEGLTSKNDYVMPSVSLMEHLATATRNKSTGAVVLSGTTIIGNAAANKLSADVFGAILDGLNAVGLTNEARALCVEILAGLSKQ